MIKIVQKEKEVLHVPTIEVDLNSISSNKIQNVIKNMKIALASEKEGVAISANQIGESLKIFVVSGKAFLNKEDMISINRGERKQIDVPEDKVFINPKLIKSSKDKEWIEEGCLSVKNIYGLVERTYKATVRAYDEKGKLFTLGGSGLLAQIFQHEIDHLNGVLFTEKAKDLQEIYTIKDSGK